MRCFRSTFAIAAAAAAVYPLVAGAQVSGTWINPAGGSWTVGSNWSSNPNYPDAAGTAEFVGNVATVSLNANVVLDTLKFDPAAPIYIGKDGGGNTKQLSFTGNLLINVDTVSIPIPGLPKQSHSLEVSLRPVVLTDSLHFTGPGAVTLRGFGIDDGDTILDGGVTLGLANAGALTGTNSFLIDGATLRAVSANGLLSTTPVIEYKPIVSQVGGATFEGLTAPLGVGTISGSGPITFTGIQGVALLTAVTADGDARIINVGTLGVQMSSPARMVNLHSLRVGGLLSITGVGETINGSADRLGEGTVALAGGSLTFNGSSSASGNEHFGTLTLAGAGNTLEINPAMPLTLTSTALQRTERGTLTIRHHGLGGSNPVQMARLYFDTAPALVGGGGAAGTPDISIIPYITPDPNAAGPTFFTYDATGVRPLAFGAESPGALPVDELSTINLRATSGITVSTPHTVNSLLMALNGNAGGSATLTVSSGALAGGIFTCPINFGSAEGIISNCLVSGPISGSNGVTFSGNGTFRGSLSTYTGTTTFNSGLWSVIMSGDVLNGAAGPFGADTSPIVLMGRGKGVAMQFSGVAGQTVQRDFIVRADPDLARGFEPMLSGIVTLSGHFTLEGPLALMDSTKISGDISGPGRIVSPEAFTHLSTVILSGNNTFTGGVHLDEAAGLLVGSNTALGSGTLYVGNGAVNAGGDARFGILPVINSPPITRTIANPIVLTDNLKLINPGTLLLTGPINLNYSSISISAADATYIQSPAVTISGPISNGQLNFIGTGSISSNLSISALTKSAPGNLFMPNARVPALNITGGSVKILANGTNAGTSKLKTLSITAGQHLYLEDNDLVVDNTPAGDIRTMLIDGRLTSTLADANHRLGYGDNALLGYGSFSGQPTTPTSILVKYTFNGDADLDGDVDLTDLVRFSQNYLASGVWTSGDFNYDGTVDLSDLVALSQNWQAGIYNPLAPSFDEALASVGLPQVLVPEPGSVAILGIAACMLHHRRRRSTR